MVECLACGSSSLVAMGSISRLVIGNEEIYSLYRCSDCGKYLLDCYEDIFLPVRGEPDPKWTLGPFDGTKGELLVRLIAGCPSPHDKRCECKAHERFFEEI